MTHTVYLLLCLYYTGTLHSKQKKTGAKFKILECSKQTLSPFPQQSTLTLSIFTFSAQSAGLQEKCEDFLVFADKLGAEQFLENGNFLTFYCTPLSKVEQLW
jgi:hypothetical protein